MFSVKSVLGNIVFLLLFGYFLLRVFHSYNSLNARKIGTSTTQQFSENRDYISEIMSLTTAVWVFLIVKRDWGDFDLIASSLSLSVGF